MKDYEFTPPQEPQAESLRSLMLRALAEIVLSLALGAATLIGLAAAVLQ